MWQYLQHNMVATWMSEMFRQGAYISLKNWNKKEIKSGPGEKNMEIGWKITK